MTINENWLQVKKKMTCLAEGNSNFRRSKVAQLAQISSIPSGQTEWQNLASTCDETRSTSGPPGGNPNQRARNISDSAQLTRAQWSYQRILKRTVGWLPDLNCDKTCQTLLSHFTLLPSNKRILHTNNSIRMLQGISSDYGDYYRL